MNRPNLNERRLLNTFQLPSLFVGFCILLVGTPGRAENWVTYRADIARSGVGSETVGPGLSLQWTRIPTHRPTPAWPMPAEEIPRMHADNALHVIAAAGRVYFGCPITGKVYAVDAATGQTDWTFATAGPVRFAPTFDAGRIYVGSDDGHVYCLDARDGTVIWKYRPGPRDEKVIGNGQLISLWPIRTSVLVDGGVAYVTAGVFPYEGIYICALNATDGALIWRNDTVADRAHELEFGGISPHGYLVASKERLYVPSGRAMPAAFDRGNGKFLFYASPGGHRGGVWTLLDGQRLVAGTVFSESQGMTEHPMKVAYDADTGEAQPDAFAWFPGIEVVPTREVLYVLTEHGIASINRLEYARALKEGAQWIKERKSLERKLSSLRVKVADSDEPDSKLQTQIDESGKRLVEVRAKEEALKKSCLRWYYVAKGLVSLIKAGDIVYAGGRNTVVGVDDTTGKEIWREAVNGTAVGMAVADGRFLVSTDQGPIHCFGPDKVATPTIVKRSINPNPYSEDEQADVYHRAAQTILQDSGVSRGYCLVRDCNIGNLAFELARGSALKIVGLETDPRKLKIARQRLEAAGLLGARVVVEPWEIEDLPPYFANLVVSDESIVSRTVSTKDEIIRVLRPCGGVFMMCNAPHGDASTPRVWSKYVRPELPGAGSWRQLYANPQNTACSGDASVKGPLGVLWFGAPGPQGIVDRHARTDSPLSIGGRLFIPGEELVRAYDAYNGTFLWETKLPGAVRARVDVDGGNFSLTTDSLYVAVKDVCYRLDNATGKIVRQYHMPGTSTGSVTAAASDRRWGYVCCIDGILVGTEALPLHADYGQKYARRREALPPKVRRGLQRSGALWRTMTDFPSWGSQASPADSLARQIMTADAVFALDADTGKSLWVYRSKGIANITLSVGDGTLFFAECNPTKAQRVASMEETERLVQAGVYQQDSEAGLEPDQRDVRLVVALELPTGKTQWKKPLDLTGCGGNKMGSAFADGLLLFFGHFSNHDQKFFQGGKLTWRRIVTVDAGTGQIVWSRPLNYLRRPVIMGDRIIIEPRACDLRTGAIIDRRHPVTGADVPWEFLRPGHSCGVSSASAHTLFYRSFCAAIYDMEQDKGLSLFGGFRTGCWLDIIAANGLMLMPERSSGCTCSYPLRCSVALVHKPSKAMGNWSVFVSSGAMTPVTHLALDLGAPGDVRDDNGLLWLGYPRIRKTFSVYNANPHYGIQLDIHEKFLPGGGFYGADKKRLFASGCRGLLRCELPLIDKEAGQEPAAYTVRLGLSMSSGESPHRREFDIKLQGRIVARDSDVVRAVEQGKGTVVMEFESVAVTDALVIELVPKSETPDLDRAPIINFIEVIREDAASSH